jgi:RimJ/RimL family protein N-acetyltransferase
MVFYASSRRLSRGNWARFWYSCDGSRDGSKRSFVTRKEVVIPTNHLGQLIGDPVTGWTPPPPVERAHAQRLSGAHCRLEPLDPAHAEHLHDANARDADGRMWTYLPYGPFDSLDAYCSWVSEAAATDDPLFFAIVDSRSDRATGVASYLRIDPPAGAIEVGHIAYSPLLQRTQAATEAMYLMMRLAFELGYRRYEWKCDALNAPSRSAAERLGLSDEGVFRQARVYKGRNRDTAWYAAIDKEWPALDAAFRHWLSPSNFDAKGNQRVSLRALTAPIRAAAGTAAGDGGDGDGGS